MQRIYFNLRLDRNDDGTLVINHFPGYGLTRRRIDGPFHSFLYRASAGKAVESDCGAYAVTMSEVGLFFNIVSRVFSNSRGPQHLKGLFVSLDSWPSTYTLLLRSMTVGNCVVSFSFHSQFDSRQMASLLSVEKGLDRVHSLSFSTYSKGETETWYLISAMLVKRATHLKRLCCKTFLTASKYPVDLSKLTNAKKLFYCISRSTNKRVRVEELSFYHHGYNSIRVFSEKDLNFLETIAKMVAKTANIRLSRNLHSRIQN